MFKGKTIQDISREIPMYPDPMYRSPPKLTEIPIPDVPRYLLNFDPEIHMDYK